MKIIVISRVYRKDGTFYNEWKEECNSWRKAWAIAKGAGAQKSDCVKMFDNF